MFDVQGVAELPPDIHTWVFMSTTFADYVAPVLQYGLMALGALTLVIVFIRAYKNLVFTAENIELGKQKLRRGTVIKEVLSSTEQQQYSALMPHISTFILVPICYLVK